MSEPRSVELGVYARVGAILAPSNAGSSRAICTGLLLDREHVLTAAHCVVLHPHQTLQFVLPAKGAPSRVFAVVSTRVHPAFRVCNTRAGMHDIAVLTLSDGPMEGSSTVALAKEPPRPGETVVLVGTANIVATNHGHLIGTANTSVERVSSVEFTVPPAPSPQPCAGDSGGPAFVQREGLALVGIASRAAVDTDDACQQGAVYTRVDVHAAWVEAVVAGDVPPNIGAARGSGPEIWLWATVVVGIVVALWFVRRRVPAGVRRPI